MLTLPTRSQLVTGLVLAALMGITRSHHFASITHLPDASWAVFFLAGCYLRPAWVLPALLVEAGLLDYTAITWNGVSSFCVSPAYVFLLPAYGALWFAGHSYAKRYRFDWATLTPLALCVFAGALICELLSSGGFYFISGRFAEPTFAEFGGRLLKYFPHSLQALGFYLVIATLVHTMFSLLRGSSHHHDARLG